MHRHEDQSDQGVFEEVGRKSVLAAVLADEQVEDEDIAEERPLLETLPEECFRHIIGLLEAVPFGVWDQVCILCQLSG